MRLQKVLAQAGVASRRKCETLMSEGRVEVDGAVVTQLGAKVDPERAVIRVDGKRIPVAQAHVYLVANKPRGVVSSMADEEGRRDLRSLLGDRPERLFHVGRLDTDTDGLIVLTNDGEFAHRLAHPSFELQKTYVAQVEGVVKPSLRATLLAGVTLEDGPVQARRVQGQGQPGRQDDGRGGAARGPQPHRAAADGVGGAPGAAAVPYRDRPGPARPAQVRRRPRTHRVTNSDRCSTRCRFDRRAKIASGKTRAGG